MIVAAAVLVEQDNEQCTFPIWTVAERAINRSDQRLPPVKVRRPVELVGIALWVHVIVWTPNDRVEIDGFDKGIVG